MNLKLSHSYHAAIGVIGHVDHGKTSLIYALTGILTARKHEQKLGMTQDLGFAHFDDGQGHNIGIVDVPGHERYIRNMVSGVASLNAVLLVISATEGWMPMTTDHVLIAQALGHTNIIICINKSDLVSAQTLDELEEIVLEKVMDMTGIVPEVVPVSALTHAGIDHLKQTIIDTVVPNPQNNIENESELLPARLYIDRCFTVNGLGTVVTGTLAQGTISFNDKVYIAPSPHALKVRSIQAYHQECDSVQGVSRVAICLKGVKRKDIKRGDCLISKPDACVMADQIIVRLSDDIKPAGEAKNNKNIEVALGSWHGFGQLIYLKDTRLVRIKLTKPAPVFFGQPIALMRHGGSTLIHGGFIVWTEEVSGFLRHRLYQTLSNLDLPIHVAQQDYIQFTLNGYIEHDRIDSNAVGDSATTVTHDKWLFDKTWLTETVLSIQNRLNQPETALSNIELSHHLRMNTDTVAIVTQYLKQQKVIHFSYGKWNIGDGDSEDDLTLDAQQLLQNIRNKGKDGFELSKEDITSAEKSQLRNLSRLKYVIHIEGEIYYDSQRYQSLVKAILADHVKGDKISMGDIKDRSGLSRKYSIPLANRMEIDGWVRRQENDRIILKAYHE
jgi:selenocysteine-specific elongation factor